MFKISVMQICDVCGTSREIPPPRPKRYPLAGDDDLVAAGSQGGWRAIDNRWVCPEDINRLFKK